MDALRYSAAKRGRWRSFFTIASSWEMLVWSFMDSSSFVHYRERTRRSPPSSRRRRSLGRASFHAQLMRHSFLEIPLPLIHEDERYPDRDNRHIYEHLKYVHSFPRLFPLPSIHVRFIKGRFVVIANHKYLRIARELHDPWIRALLTAESKSPIDLFKQLSPEIRITPRDVLEREQ